MPDTTAEELKQLEDYRDWAAGYSIYIDMGGPEQCVNDKQREGYADAEADEKLWHQIESNRLVREAYVYTF